jgi:hypothetical protein
MTPTGEVRRRRLVWVGRGLGMLVGSQMVFSAAMKVFLPAGVPEHFAALRWRLDHMRGLALLELAVTALYCVPRTAVVGVVLLTGYLGGATAAHVRIGDGTFAYPAAVGVIAWIALWLCRPELRAVLGSPARVGSPR